MTTTTKLEIYRSDLLDAMLAVEKTSDTTSLWSCVRIDPDGTIRTSEEVSRCFGEDEYYHRMPHTVTVHARTGTGACAVEDWDDPVIMDSLSDEIAGVVETLEHAGYDVEVV